MAGSTGGQYEVDPALWFATHAGKTSPSYASPLWNRARKVKSCGVDQHIRNFFLKILAIEFQKR